MIVVLFSVMSRCGAGLHHERPALTERGLEVEFSCGTAPLLY